MFVGAVDSLEVTASTEVAQGARTGSIDAAIFIEGLGLTLVVLSQDLDRVIFRSEQAKSFVDQSAQSQNQVLAQSSNKSEVLFNQFPGLRAVLLSWESSSEPNLNVYLERLLPLGTEQLSSYQVFLKAIDDSLFDEPGILIRFESFSEQRLAAVRHLSDRERLMQLSRSLSVGEMATTFAHELNQPIGSITNLLQGLDRRISESRLDAQSAREAIARGIKQALYAAGVIQRMREYVQSHSPQFVMNDPATLLEDSLELLDWELARGQVSVERRWSQSDLKAASLG
jgi:signal transduction histidine kinase